MASNPAVTNPSQFVQSLLAAYPDLLIHDAYLHQGDGQNSNILVVNDTLIFRFPRYAQGIAALRREVAVLRFLQGRVSLPAPHPLYVTSTFVGYPRLPGAPLWADDLARFDHASRERVAAQLAAFLRELHALRPLDLGLPTADGSAVWRAMYGDIQQHLFPRMRPDACAEVSRHFDAYLNDPRLHQFTPTLRHGDFGGANILHDPATRHVTGVVDFGACALGDPAVDLAAVSTYGEAFAALFGAAYGATDEEWERAAFYRGTFALQEALHGFTTGDAAALASGLEPYV